MATNFTSRAFEPEDVTWTRTKPPFPSSDGMRRMLRDSMGGSLMG